MTNVLRLKHAQFIGDSSPIVRTSGFSYAEVAHTARSRVPLHSHDDAHFVLILKGDYATSARAVGRTQASPTLIFNPPGTTHCDHFRSDVGRFFTVSVAPEQFSRLSDARISIDHPVSLASGDADSIAMKMFREYRNMDSLTGVVLEGLGLELLARTGRGVNHERSRTAPPWLAHAVELMQERCCTDLSVRDVAAEVGVHPYHLARVARRYLGRSPGELIREYRLRRTLGLLAAGRLSVGEIALMCGYSDQSQFTRAFKRETGTTPAAFRRGLHEPVFGAAQIVS